MRDVKPWVENCEGEGAKETSIRRRYRHRGRGSRLRPLGEAPPAPVGRNTPGVAKGPLPAMTSSRTPASSQRAPSPSAPRRTGCGRGSPSWGKGGAGSTDSYDFLENPVGCDIHSADRIVPGLHPGEDRSDVAGSDLGELQSADYRDDLPADVALVPVKRPGPRPSNSLVVEPPVEIDRLTDSLRRWVACSYDLPNELVKSAFRLALGGEAALALLASAARHR